MWHEYLNTFSALCADIEPTSIEAFAGHLNRTRYTGRTIFTCGNGGSASAASHLAQDLSKGAIVEGAPRLRVVCLCDSIPNITAWANDEGYENIFSEQLRGLGRQGDVLVAISGSGNSENVLRAVRAAHDLEMRTWGVTGFDGGRLRSLAQRCVHVPCADMGMAEAAHGLIFHWLVDKLAEGEEHKQPAPSKQGAIFIDRDGTINAKAPPGQHVVQRRDFHFLPGALDALAFLHKNSERKIVVVTNQSCIGRGTATWPQVLNLHAWMEASIEIAGGHLDGVYVCPHTPEDDCACRKPKPGLLRIAACGLDIDLVHPNEPLVTLALSQSAMIGDSATDIEAAWAAGIHECYQVLREGQTFPAGRNYIVIENLMAAAKAAVRRGG